MEELWRVWDWNGNNYYYSSKHLAYNKCINLIVNAYPNPETPEEFEERDKCFEELEDYRCAIDICGYDLVEVKDSLEDEEEELNNALYTNGF